MAIIGIDLGTTNSLGAVYRNHKVELIPNRFGSFLTPSVVSVTEDGTVLVGEVAKERLVTHPEATAASFKKDMGTEKKYVLGKKTFLPEELSSFVIRSIVEDAKNYLQEDIEEVIVSVPAYFHDKQRVATKKAGALAGVTVKRIINEPSAAAMASYIDTSKEQLFLIFDFGGGTLDVSVVECFDTMVEIISVAGDNHLGGDDFHEIMAESFLSEHGLSKRNVSPKTYAILLRQAEMCKRRLTDDESAKMTLNLDGTTYQSMYTNQRLLDESARLLGKIKGVLSRALRDGDLSINDLHAVVMVGGSSKMPLIQSYLQHIFRNLPVVVSNSDLMIAQGLGLICAVKERNEEIKDYVLTDICPFTLGTNVVNHADPSHPYMSPIIERNTVLPCSKIKRFYTASDNQTTLRFEILQGEQPYAEDNLKLSEISVTVPKKKSGEESADVRFTYDINGILIVDVKVLSTGQSVSRVISQNMREKELQRKVDELQKLKVHPKEITENMLVMEKLKALFEEVPPYMREHVQNFIRNFEMVLEGQNTRRIAKYRRFLEQMIAQMEGYDPLAQEIIFEEFDENEEDEIDENEEDDEDKDEEEGGIIWTS
ncbi:MAG: Hsp70 family protein [Tyzzerella sp.]|nr:Hsp70 family protein [Tyzzerella sp.]